MPGTYEYKVRDQQGRLVKGRLEAESVPLVAGRLREMGYIPIDIQAASSINLRTEIEIPGLTDRVKLKEVAVMSRQLATMVAAGLTLVRALGVLADQMESKQLRNALLAVRGELGRGVSFSQALEQHPRIFDPLYLAMVRAGEASGQLDQVLLDLASSIEHRVELRGKVRSAMSYPAIVVFVVIAILVAMMVVVVPTFKHLYASLHGTLPLPTRIVIQVSGMLASLWALAILAGLVAVMVGVRRWARTDRGRRTVDRLKLRPPVFGPLAHKIALSRFATTLSSLLSSGVGIIAALEITAENVGNRVLADAVRAARGGVREGRSLGSTLADDPVVPPMVTQMIETGEEAGAVSEMLAKVGQFYDGEIAATVNSLTALLEPCLIVFMGACVGAVVISLYLPMFDYVKLLSPGGGG